MLHMTMHKIIHLKCLYGQQAVGVTNPTLSSSLLLTSSLIVNTERVNRNTNCLLAIK